MQQKNKIKLNLFSPITSFNCGHSNNSDSQLFYIYGLSEAVLLLELFQYGCQTNMPFKAQQE
jgi:hypothetical protein